MEYPRILFQPAKWACNHKLIESVTRSRARLDGDLMGVILVASSLGSVNAYYGFFETDISVAFCCFRDMFKNPLVCGRDKIVILKATVSRRTVRSL